MPSFTSSVPGRRRALGSAEVYLDLGFGGEDVIAEEVP
jgi:hypothetical protein